MLDGRYNGRQLLDRSQRRDKMSNLRTIVRGAYDIQKLRIQMGNRIVGNFKAKIGQEPSKPETALDAEGQMILKQLRLAYKKITDGVTTFPRQKTFKGDEVISDYTELVLLSQYLELETSEDRHFRLLGNVLKEYPIFSEFLDGVKGVGPAMAGVIVSEFNIHEARYASSLWKYCGLDVIDGEGRSRKKHHLVKRKYVDKDGCEQERDSITFNPFLKTKLVGVLGPSFLRAGDNKYSRIYRDYKLRLESRPDLVEESKGRRHNMAIRYMVKMFLIDLYTAWRKLEGLPVAPSYAEGKLGIKHSQAS